jgi:hypothetical protein
MLALLLKYRKKDNLVSQGQRMLRLIKCWQARWESELKAAETGVKPQVEIDCVPPPITAARCFRNLRQSLILPSSPSMTPVVGWFHETEGAE